MICKFPQRGKILIEIKKRKTTLSSRGATFLKLNSKDFLE
jgi:hypothetical protein